MIAANILGDENGVCLRKAQELQSTFDGTEVLNQQKKNSLTLILSKPKT